MTERVTKVMNEDEKTMLQTAAFFIVCYAPWFLKSLCDFVKIFRQNEDLDKTQVLHVAEVDD
jgi:hypothetical protein